MIRVVKTATGTEPATHTYRIVSNGAEAEHTLAELIALWRDGALARDAQYLHSCGQWKPLAKLVVPRIQDVDRQAQQRAQTMARPKTQFGRTPLPTIEPVGTRSRAVYLLLGLVGGGLGIHNFYAGHFVRAAFQLALAVAGVFLAGGPWIVLGVWVLAELFFERYDRDGKLLG
jgi:hypothetical protein